MIHAILLTILAALGAVEANEAPPGMVLVPAGEFVQGRNDGPWDEAPAHTVTVSAFWIDRTEVSNAQYLEFVRATDGIDQREGPWFRGSLDSCLDVLVHFGARYGSRYADFKPPVIEDPEQRSRLLRDLARWRTADQVLREELQGTDVSPDATLAELRANPEVLALIASQSKLPVTFVSWRDARDYAKWCGKRLPTEAEWEKAARGTDGRAWPWGTEWAKERCRAGLPPVLSPIFDPYRAPDPDLVTGPGPVDGHPDGASPHGCLGMAGNVWEWCADWYGETYYREAEGAVDPTGPAGLADGRLPAPHSETELLRDPRQGRASNTRKVMRGGSWCGPPYRASYDTRTTRRMWSNPTYWHADVGFRCVKDA